MKQNKIKITYYVSLFINFISTVIKIIGGIIGSSEILLVDGLNTACEFVSNFISLIGNKISHKRRNQTHPFGYGTVEYLSNLIVGFIILFLGLILLVKTFISKAEVPNINLIYILLFVMVCKLILGVYLNKKSTELNSSSLLVSSKQSFMDLYSSFLTLIVIVLSQFSEEVKILKYSDFVGSLIISLMIVYTGFKIIKENILPLSGEVDSKEEILEEIEEKIEKLVDVDLTKTNLIKYGSYYQAEITIKIDPKIDAKKIVKYETLIKNKLKASKYHIKHVFIDIELDDMNRKGR